MASAAERKALYRLRHDTPFYAKHCLWVVDERGALVPFVFRKAQMKLWRAVVAQRAAGRPVRVIILKSRKVGISTAVQAIIFHGTTLEANCKSVVVAQDTDTAGDLFEISDLFYSKLPQDVGEEFRPGLVGRSVSEGGAKKLAFGEPSRIARARGELGVNSSLKIDTAKTVTAGRGKTIRKLHASEVAFWDQAAGAVNAARGSGRKKALSLFNAVPDQPGTEIYIESTANGHNWFKGRWDRAEAGRGGYATVFIGWTEDENCTREFDDPEHRAVFVESIGTGVYGADEPYLIERFGATPEQLHWRRTTIDDKCDGDLSQFRQEYPSSPLEAFVGSGKHVFSIRHIERAEDEARSFDPPREDDLLDVQPGDGLLVPAGYERHEMALSTQEVPTGTLWLPAGPAQVGSGKALWRVWEHPVTPVRAVEHDIAEREFDTGLREEPPRTLAGGAGRPYVVFADVAAGEDQTSEGETDYHAIQVIDHLERTQVAQYRSRVDRDELALQILLAALYFNGALVAVETTGGLGLTVVETLWKRMRYRNVYRRRAQGSAREKQQLMLGWDTNRNTKPAMEDEAAALLREGSHGIRSLDLVSEMKTYVRFDNGQRGADDECFDDLLMAWMGAQRVAQVVSPRVARERRAVRGNSMTRRVGRRR